MQTLPISDLQPGMITAEDFRTLHGVAYLKAGTVLTERSIRQLRDRGVSQAAILDESEVPEAEAGDQEFHLTRTWRLARSVAAEKLEILTQEGLVDPAFLHGPLVRALRNVLGAEENLVLMDQLLAHDEYTFRHSIGVAIYSGFIGQLCHFSQKKLHSLVLGGFLHDIGKLDVPEEILNKPSKLDDAEFEIVQRHPETGEARLRAYSGPRAQTMAEIASQHHQHLDGGGYPLLKPTGTISRFSRIVAIADVYDALTSARSYKVAYKPHIAYRIMTKLSRGQFDDRLLNLFFNHLIIFPVGSVLETSAGFAIVKKAPFGATAHPRICVFADSYYRMIEPYEVDLARAADISVSSLLEDISLISLTTRLHFNPAELLEQDYPERPDPAGPDPS